MSYSSPKVSITMPTYNGATFIREAINSVLSQSFSDLELIVVVDGSIDNTLEILKEYNDPRIKLIHKKVNGGLPLALNIGLENSKGEYWVYLSDDDLFMPDAIKAMVEYLDSQPEIFGVLPGAYIIDKQGRIKGRLTNYCNCVFWRKEAVLKVGGFRQEYMVVEDADLFLRMKYYFGSIARIPQAYFKYRIHKERISYTLRNKRALVSLKMHFDLINRGIEKADLEELFFDRLSETALFDNRSCLDEVLLFAKEKNVAFYFKLEKKVKFYKTRLGWLANKIKQVIRNRISLSYFKFVAYLRKHY